MLWHLAPDKQPKLKSLNLDATIFKTLLPRFFFLKKKNPSIFPLKKKQQQQQRDGSYSQN